VAQIGDRFIARDPLGVPYDCEVVWTPSRNNPLMPSWALLRKNGASLGNFSKEKRAQRTIAAGSRGAVGRVDHRLSRPVGVGSAA
jgi:hypothetical protein